MAKINRKIAAGRFALTMAYGALHSVITVHMAYQLKYIEGSGGEFVWHTLICSPDCAESFPTHHYRTSAEYIINEIYRPTRQPREWPARLELLSNTDLTEWVDMDCHTWHDPQADRFYAPSVKDRPADIWLYHSDLHRIKSWRTIHQSHRRREMDITWADLPAVHNQMHKRKYQLGKLGRYHCVDWIWSDWNASAYEAICRDVGLTPATESAEQLHTEYARVCERLAKYWLSWYRTHYQPEIDAVIQDIRQHLLD